MNNRNPVMASERGGALQVILWILGGLVLLVLLVVVITIWAVHTFVDIEISRSGEGTRVEIVTPLGAVSVSDAGVAAEDLGLPLYPKAVAQSEGGTFSLRGGEDTDGEGWTIRGAKFRVRATMEEVDAWYRQQLGEEFERHEGDNIEIAGMKGWASEIDFDVDGVAYIEDREGRVRGVVLEKHGRRIEIGLFEIREDRPL